MAKSGPLLLIFIAVLQLSQLYGVNSVTTDLYFGCFSSPEGTGRGITITEEVQQFQEYNFTEVVYSRSPSFMTTNSAGDIVYAVNELADYDMESGTISAFRFGSDGYLTLISIVPIIGSRPCHLTVDPSGKFLLTASYASGNVEVFQILEDGTIGLETNNVYAPTSDPSIAMAHMVMFEPTLQHVAVAFKGLDTVYFYNLDENGILTDYSIELSNGSLSHVRAEFAEGSGPRHIAYSPDGNYFYVISELASTITVFAAQFNAEDGIFPFLQTISTVPEDFNGTNWASEIAIHSSGLYLFAADRGSNTIASYSIDTATGLLTLIAFQWTSGQTPRHFAIDPSEVALYAANQDSDTVDVFQINGDGTLLLSYTIDDIPTPTFVLYKQFPDVLDEDNGKDLEVHVQ